MKKQKLSQGQKAKANGRRLETQLSDVLTRNGIKFKREQKETSVFTNYTMVDHVIENHPTLGRVIIEAKNGDVAGSHYQKLPFNMMNSIVQNCDTFILLVEGNFLTNHSMLDWCRRFTNNPSDAMAEFGMTFNGKDTKKRFVCNLREVEELLNK